MVMELVSWCIMLYSQAMHKFMHTYDLMEVLLKVTHRYWRKWQVGWKEAATATTAELGGTTAKNRAING